MLTSTLPFISYSSHSLLHSKTSPCHLNSFIFQGFIFLLFIFFHFLLLQVGVENKGFMLSNERYKCKCGKNTGSKFPSLTLLAWKKKITEKKPSHRQPSTPLPSLFPPTNQIRTTATQPPIDSQPTQQNWQTSDPRIHTTNCRKSGRKRSSQP